MLGGTAAFFGARDALHQHPGGVVGVVVGLALVVAGIAVVTWMLRAADDVAAADWRELRARGGDDGLPRGAFRQDQCVGLEASDRWLIIGVVAAGAGLLFLVSGLADPLVGWRFGLGFSLVGFVPAALFFRLGTGVTYWLTPEGVAKRGKVRPAVRWTDVERVVPMSGATPVAAGGYADAFELQVGSSEQAGPGRWLRGGGFIIKLTLVEIARPDLLRLLGERIPVVHDQR